MTIESKKTLGGIGAILMAIGLLPFAGAYTGIIALVGLILVLISVKGFSDYFKDSSIFNNVLYAIVIVIVGAIVAGVFVATAAIGLLNSIGISIGNLYDLGMTQRLMQNVNINTILPYITTILLGLVLLFVVAIVAAIFVRRSMTSLSEKTRVHLFATTGLLFLIGAILIIVLIGFILLWVSLLLLAVSFFTIPSQLSQQPPQQPVSPPQTPQ